MATKYYGINDKWTDDDLANVIEVASEDGTVSSVKVNGVEYGGGGGGVTGIKQINITGTVTGGEGYELFVDGPKTADYNPIGTRVNDTGTKMTDDGVVFTSSTPTTVAWYIPETAALPVYIDVPALNADATAYNVSGDAEKEEDPNDPGFWHIKATGDFAITGPGLNE